MGFGVWGLGFGVPGFLSISGLGFRVRVSGFRFGVWASGFGVLGFVFQVPGSGFRVSGIRFRVPDSGFLVPGSGCSGFRVT